MPKNYALDVTPATEQRRPENAMDDAWIKAFLHRAKMGHIATRWDDQPFINTTTFWYEEARHRILFHSNVVGRIRANSERHPRVCFEASEFGRFLPSNIALEFSVQYESVVAYGNITVLADLAEKRTTLEGLVAKYFPTVTPGDSYRPITEKELLRTSVYAIAIESWSGKRNWELQAEQSDEWKPLAMKTLAEY